MAKQDWPKDVTTWHEGRRGFMSVPFTWLLPKAQRIITQQTFWADVWTVGGPAVRLMPDYLRGATVDTGDLPGVLQRVNPRATRTTVGCPNRCRFCGVGRGQLEPAFAELHDWPDLPVVCDSNLLAASREHFDRVLDRLATLGEADFNQGLDSRLLTAYHAERLAEIPKLTIRLALDSDGYREAFADAIATLRAAGIARSKIRAYVLIGFDGTPDQDAARCEYVERLGVKPLPMWYHRLDALERNAVTLEQEAAGWTTRKRRKLMCWYYWHRTLETRR